MTKDKENSAVHENIVNSTFSFYHLLRNFVEFLYVQRTNRVEDCNYGNTHIRKNRCPHGCVSRSAENEHEGFDSQ